MSRFFRPDPKVLLDRSAPADKFCDAMSSIHVGATVKITGQDRHPEADDLLLRHLDLDGAAIVDLGASDGSTSVDLIRRLPVFSAYTVADLFLSVSAGRSLRHVLIFDSQECILVAGRWLAAWPTLSPVIRAICRPFEVMESRHPERREQVLLLNPTLQAMMRADPRITARVHDVFTPWPAPAPDVFKVANLLRRVYFSDAEISQALDALYAGLDEGGHLLVVDDGQRYTVEVAKGTGARAGLYRREGGRFVVVGETTAAPEISDLVAGVERRPLPRP